MKDQGTASAVPRARLGPLYGHAVACCIPSVTYEPFPTVAIEAFARRTPVIAHDLGGLTEIVTDSGGEELKGGVTLLSYTGTADACGVSACLPISFNCSHYEKDCRTGECPPE